MIRRPPRSTLSPTRRSSDLVPAVQPAPGAPAQQAARRPLPPITGEAQLDFPRVERARLSNGIQVVYARRATVPVRSEEHTSELQSRQYLVCRLLLEKKNYSP